MMIKEVATACLIDNLANNTKAGTIINPPPAPTKPVRSPTPNPMTSKKRSFLLESDLEATVVGFFIIKTEDKIIMRLKNNINAISLVMVKLPIDIITSGRFGIINRRVRNTDTNAGSVNMKAVLYSINFFLIAFALLYSFKS